MHANIVREAYFEFVIDDFSGFVYLKDIKILSVKHLVKPSIKQSLSTSKSLP
jgi:hypothetical protein